MVPCVVMLCWYGTISMGCAVLSITLVMVWGDDPCDGMCFGVLCCVVLCCVVLCCGPVLYVDAVLCYAVLVWCDAIQYDACDVVRCEWRGVV